MKTNDLIPIAILAGLVYAFRDKIRALINDMDAPDPLATIEAPGYTTAWQRERQRFANTVTVLPEDTKKLMPKGISDAEQIQALTGTPANEQIIRASYEWVWANKLPDIQLTVAEWNRLRSQYISRYGGVLPNPDLSQFVPAANMPYQRFRPNEYLGMVARVLPPGTAGALAGLGCGAAVDCGCDKGGWLQ